MRKLLALLVVAGSVATAQTPTAAPQDNAAPAPAVRTVTEQTQPTLKEFPRELVRNFAALISTQNLLPLAVGAAATAAVKIPDDSVVGYFGGKPKTMFHEPGDAIGNGLVAGGTFAGMLLLGRKSDDARFRSFTYSLAQGFVVNQSIVFGIKHAVHSQRPNGLNNYSFPSGHTASAFTWATTVQHYYGWKAGIPAYLAATYVGYARLDDRAHRLTDVVAGATIGYIVGKTISRRYNPDRRVNWNVMVPPGGGVGMSFQINLPH